MTTTSASIAAFQFPNRETVRRRDFINIAAISAAGVGLGTALYPLVSQMSPSADVLALASIDVDITTIAEGQAIKVSWGKIPVFVRHLTSAEIVEAQQASMSDLRDPETLAERTKPGKSEWLVTLGICTHLNCVPLGAAQGETRGEYGGYFCPCHGSQYDTAGRIRKGPAPKNLEVPDYVFETATVIRIGRG